MSDQDISKGAVSWITFAGFMMVIGGGSRCSKGSRWCSTRATSRARTDPAAERQDLGRFRSSSGRAAAVGVRGVQRERPRSHRRCHRGDGQRPRRVQHRAVPACGTPRSSRSTSRSSGRLTAHGRDIRSSTTSTPSRTRECTLGASRQFDRKLRILDEGHEPVSDGRRDATGSPPPDPSHRPSRVFVSQHFGALSSS